MSTFKEPERDYKFTDARLVEIALEKIAFAERDVTELATVGVTAVWVDALNDSVLAFAAMPDDTVEAAEQVEATGEKVIDADKVMDKLKELRSAALRAFGENSTKYQRFGFKGLDKFTDAELLKTGLLANGLATTYAAPLATKGFDATDNAELATLCTTYVSGLQNQSLEIGSRDSAQEARVLAGNALYKDLEKELCEAGKSYWRTRSAAKFNDYLIYNTESGTAPHETIDFEVNGLETITLVTIPYIPTRNFTIENNTPTAFNLFLSNDGTTPTGITLAVPGNTSASHPTSFLGASGNKFVVRNNDPGTAAGGRFMYEV